MFLLLVVTLDRPCSNVQCKAAGYTLHSHFSPSLPLPCVTVCRQVPIALYHGSALWFRYFFCYKAAQITIWNELQPQWLSIRFSRIFLFHAVKPLQLKSLLRNLEGNGWCFKFWRFLSGWRCRCLRLLTLPTSWPGCLEMWEPQPAGTLRTCSGLYTRTVSQV